MAKPSDPSRPAWHSVLGDVAPSKPAVPPGRAAPQVRPEPVPAEEADIVAPVTLPPVDEIMPISTEVPPPPTPAAHARDDLVERLGSSAVENASWPTSAYPRATRSRHPSSTVTRPSDDAGEAATPESPAEPPDFDGGVPYVPPIVATHGVGHADTDKTIPDSGTPGRRRWWRRPVVIVLVVLLVLAGLGIGLTAVWNSLGSAEAAPAAAVTHTPQPTLSPIEIEDATVFLAAMPTTVGTFALVSVDTDLDDDIELTGRTVESHRLSYRDNDQVVTVHAIQHFNEADALVQLENLGAEGGDPQPVLAGDAQVGERVTVDNAGETTIVWRNGTAVLTASGAEDRLDDFWTAFPL